MVEQAGSRRNRSLWAGLIASVVVLALSGAAAVWLFGATIADPAQQSINKAKQLCNVPGDLGVTVESAAGLDPRAVGGQGRSAVRVTFAGNPGDPSFRDDQARLRDKEEARSCVARAFQTLQAPAAVTPAGPDTALHLDHAYLQPDSVDLKYRAVLAQQLQRHGVELADSPAQDGIKLLLKAQTEVREGLTVGSTRTWQATATAALSALRVRDQASLFWSSFEGHGTATNADAATRNAVDDAAAHLASQYDEFVKNRS